MSKNPYRLNWKGDLVAKMSEEQICAIMGEIALIGEGEAKKELQKGRGVLTGTLRRSIHAATPDYEFATDNVEAAPASPERGNKKVLARRVGNRLVVLLGSGLSYAMAIHQGWTAGYKGMKGSFAGYHYLVNGLEKAKGQTDAVIARHQVK